MFNSYGYSFEEQEVRLLQRAKEKGFEVVGVYRDGGISGKNVTDRPEMKRLIQDIKTKRIDVLMAWKMSRTFRKLKDLLDVFDIMKDNGCIFYFEKDGEIDPNSSSGKLHAQVLGMVAEIERDGIAENVAMGMEARAKAGEFNGGTPPLGYALENSRLVIIPEEAQIVRKVFDMYNSGSGYKHIAQVLNNGGYRTKQGRLFSVGTIQGIISNETYAGWIIWGKVRNWNEKRRKGTNPNPIRAKGKHEPIISQETFDTAKKVRLERGGKAKRKHNDLNILTSILRCPECGSGMVLSRSVGGGKPVAYYSCGRWKNKGNCGCHSNSIKLETANNKVLGEISRLINDEVLVRRITREINNKTSDLLEGAMYDQENTELLLKRTETEVQKLQKRFLESDDIEPDFYKRRMKELTEHMEVYKKNLYSAREQISKNTKCSYSLEQVKTILKLIKPILEKSKVEEVRTLMHLMIEEITIDRKTRSVDTISIKFNRQLTEYLCLQEGASKEASFFSALKEEELAFVIRL